MGILKAYTTAYMMMSFHGNGLPFRFSCELVSWYEDIRSIREEISETMLIGVKAKVANKETIAWLILTTCMCVCTCTCRVSIRV